jgi:hypothetical protein
MEFFARYFPFASMCVFTLLVSHFLKAGASKGFADELTLARCRRAR